MEDGKILKVCLAMGGGVSLGSYSGAALTEALKLLILTGQDSDGKPYKSVEVDGMSGASAGSIALAIMMRCLVDYKSLMNIKPILDHLKLPEGTSKDEVDKHLRSSISKEYKLSLIDHRLDKLVALEIAQVVQKIIWVNTLNSDLLFKTNSNSDDDFLTQFGLLSRDSAIDAAWNVISPGIIEIDITNKKVLSNRALMAFTMANLSPISYGEKRTNQKDVPDLVKNLQNATSINNHNEVRVFDLWFLENSNTSEIDDRYITIPDGRGRSHNSDRTWAEILASAIASGAFPFGFPPAIITKYRNEYDSGEWPNYKNNNESPIPEYLNFAYVDGGTFNNEPIKEAFKLGAFIDFQTYDPDLRKKEDRLILFVDPSVPSGNRANQLKSLDPLLEVKNNTNRKKPESKKMIDMAMDLVGMVASQGEINEEAKIQTFYKSSMLNESLFAYFDSLKVFDIKLLLNTSLLKNAYANLKSSLESRHISVGTRKVSDLVYSKYRKLCYSKGAGSSCLNISSIESMYNELSIFVNEDTKSSPMQVELKLDQIVTEAGCNKAIEVPTFGMSVFLAISEMALNQFGKDFKAERAGIFPVDNNLKIEALPGSDIARFAGFASQIAREACFAKGLLDSIVCLGSDHFRIYHYNTMLKEGKTVKPFIDPEHEIIKKLKMDYDNQYTKLKDNFSTNYSADLNKNLRPKLVDRIGLIINNIITEIKDNPKTGNLISRLIGYYNLWKAWKNEESKSIINNNFNNKVLENLTQNKKNIAIKLRVKANVNNVKLSNNLEMQIDMQTVEHKNYTYFKIYLVMVDQLLDLDKEFEFGNYCYLSISNKTKKELSKEITNIGSISDPEKIDEVLVKSYPKITSASLLKAFKYNFLKFKYGINPVFEIDNQGNVTIVDLSEPLANSIEPDWKPFVKNNVV